MRDNRGFSKLGTDTHRYMHTHSWHTCMSQSSDIVNIAPLMLVKHPELHSSAHCLRVKTHHGLGCACLSLVSTIGFFLWAVLHVSSVRGRTCAGSQMTVWSDEDLIHEEADSPPRVFIVLLGFRCFQENAIK